MCSLKQKELTLDSVLQMNEQICADCPETSGCKKFQQWLRLNPIKVTIKKDHPGSNDPAVFELPYYRSRPEEVFW
jgi:hypothetical protein